jgi:hypothetical protein
MTTKKRRQAHLRNWAKDLSRQYRHICAVCPRTGNFEAAKGIWFCGEHYENWLKKQPNRLEFESEREPGQYNRTTFIKVEGDLNVFYFVCEGCRAEGQMKIPVGERRAFNCPEECGAVYIQWNRPLTESPDLTCVVCPVYPTPSHD